ncbi:S8 family serine peptidase, partial [Bacteroidota bacterium]
MKKQSKIKNLVNLIIIIFFLIVCCRVVSGQDSHWLFLSDKDGTSFDPYKYFDHKTIEKRLKLGISINEYTDRPLRADYVEIISGIVDSISYKSRWFNAVLVYANSAELNIIRSLPFITNIKNVEIQTVLANSSETYNLDIDKDEVEYLLRKQIEVMGGEKFINNGINGSGIRIAVFDGGYTGVDTSPVFEHIRKDNRIISTFDFFKKTENVYRKGSHGTLVLSCIAGMINGVKIGLATGAEFLLAITEIKSDPKLEEKNWLAAAEWADKNGADIINSSLGYTYLRYFKSDMDGQTSLVAKAATIAASKGILVINCMGNDGDNDWKIVNTPADADSVLSVGGIDPETNLHIHFSSVGPTADNRLKPNVVAFGKTVAADNDGLKIVTGTSFSCPLITGFAACAWQTRPQMKNMEIFKLIQSSGNLFPYYDYAQGYGIPQGNFFIDNNDH